MPRFDYTSTIQAPAALVFDWHRDPVAIDKLIPPWEPVTVVGSAGRIDESGSLTTLKITLLGVIPVYWVAEHRKYQKGQSFQDVQIKGPFSRWCHTHSVESIDELTCKYIDHIEYEVPIGWFGELMGGWIVRQKLKKCLPTVIRW